MVWLDLRELYLGRVRERERRSSLRDSRPEESVAEDWMESGSAADLDDMFECSMVLVCEDEELMGLGSVGVGIDDVTAVEDMVKRFDNMSGTEMARKTLWGLDGVKVERQIRIFCGVWSGR